jgi:hypothetical protein
MNEQGMLKIQIQANADHLIYLIAKLNAKDDPRGAVWLKAVNDLALFNRSTK